MSVSATLASCAPEHVDDDVGEDVVILDPPPPAPSGIVPAPLLGAPDRARTRRKTRAVVRIACDEVGLQVLRAALEPGFRDRHPDLELVASVVPANELAQRIVRRQCALAIGCTAPKHSDHRNGVKGRILARVPFVAIVHPENRLSRIGRARLGTVLSGEEPTWLELAGSSASVQVVSAKSPWQRTGHARLFPGRALRAARQLDSIAAAIRYVADQRSAVAFVPRSRLGQAAVRPLAIDDVHVNPATVRGGRYPLALELWLLRRDKLSLPVLKFVSWIGGSSQRDRLRAFGYAE